MIHAELSDGKIALTVPPTYNEMVRQLPGSRFVKNEWTLPVSWAGAKQLRATFGDLLTVGPEFTAWANAYVERRSTIQAIQDRQVVYDLDARLYDFQRTGSSWLVSVGRGLLADEPRMGKTPQVLVALRTLGAGALPALAVVPNSVKWTWAAEAEIWAPELSVQVIGGTAPQKRKQFDTPADLYIINWEAIRNHTRLAAYGSIEMSESDRTPGELDALGLVTVIADEAHRMVDPKAKQTRAMWNLMWQATYRWGMTGTPVVNRPDDVWSIMHGIAPEEYPDGKSKWVERYCVAGQGRFGWEVFGLKPETSAEFHEILRPRFLRRTRAEVGSAPQLPPQIRWVELGTKQRAAYKAMNKEQVALIDGEILVAGNPLVKHRRLSQIAAATPVLEAGEIVALTTPSAKLDAVLEILSEEPDEPVVVFSPSRKLIELLDTELQRKKYKTSLITGKVDPQMRAANVARFQIGETSVALCTTGAGAEGITLNRANKLIFLGMDESHVKNLQAKDRAEAVGKTTPVSVILVLAKDTVDESTLDNDETKEGFLQEVVRDAQRVRG